MTSVSIKTKAGVVEGTCDPKFSGVLDAFVTNFEARGEVGAQAGRENAADDESEVVVDPHGSYLRASRATAWTSALTFRAGSGERHPNEMSAAGRMLSDIRIA